MTLLSVPSSLSVAPRRPGHTGCKHVIFDPVPVGPCLYQNHAPMVCRLFWWLRSSSWSWSAIIVELLGPFGVSRADKVHCRLKHLQQEVFTTSTASQQQTYILVNNIDRSSPSISPLGRPGAVVLAVAAPAAPQSRRCIQALL